MKKIFFLIAICFLCLSCKRDLTEFDYQNNILKDMPHSSFYKSPGYSSNEFLVVDKDSNLFYVTVRVTAGGTECYVDKKQFILSFKK